MERILTLKKHSVIIVKTKVKNLYFQDKVFINSLTNVLKAIVSKTFFIHINIINSK
jgi:hypothetical protein